MQLRQRCIRLTALTYTSLVFVLSRKLYILKLVLLLLLPSLDHHHLPL